ncbi:uncharacterized mitochondrial protein AtMg00860 [Clonorchis sinensis]|uniref:Uncharacterized mitochondrial protein AtMg00860 n=1 Tax=Clonorchis sinensis TaxID=79923 RepID=G7YAL9_CLOSI|nr:uncharacterized mitochondrial protein AtMg00860 [Clonorchis sinensis]
MQTADEAIHDMRLLSLRQRFYEFSVATHPKKCTFTVPSLLCLGYFVDGSGFKPDTNRLFPLVNVPSPTYLQELRSVLGTRRFVHNVAKHASCLFDVVSVNRFSWSSNHEKMLRALLGHLHTSAVLKLFFAKDHSPIITDASFTRIGAILELCGRSSLAKSSAAMVQRWIIALSLYTYTIVHRSAKMITDADFLSRIPLCDLDSNNSGCLLIQPLPVKRDALLADIRRYFFPFILRCDLAWHNCMQLPWRRLKCPSSLLHIVYVEPLLEYADWVIHTGLHKDHHCAEHAKLMAAAMIASLRFMKHD